MKHRSIIPDQPQPEPYKTAEVMLWTHVLMVAVLDSAGRGPAVMYADHEGAREDAWEWIEADGRHVGGFAWICRRLGLEPEAIRDSLEDLDAAQVYTSGSGYHYRASGPVPPVKRVREKRPKIDQIRPYRPRLKSTKSTTSDQDRPRKTGRIAPRQTAESDITS